MEVLFPGETFSDLLEIVVDTDVFLPDMFTILLNDELVNPAQPHLEHTDNSNLFKMGAKVEITAEVTSDSSTSRKKNVLIHGEITSVEARSFGRMDRIHLPDPRL